MARHHRRIESAVIKTLRNEGLGAQTAHIGRRADAIEIVRQGQQSMTECVHPVRDPVRLTDQRLCDKAFQHSCKLAAERACALNRPVDLDRPVGI